MLGVERKLLGQRDFWAHTQFQAVYHLSPLTVDIFLTLEAVPPVSLWSGALLRAIGFLLAINDLALLLGCEFQIIGAMAEFERALIQERVKAGLRNARAKGKKLGRPRAEVNRFKVVALRDSGASWRKIAKELGVGLGTAYRLSQSF